MTENMPILTRRRIEAEFAQGIFEELKAEFGEDAARRVLSAAIVKMAQATAARMAAGARGGPSLDSFRAIQHLWTAEDALRTEVLKSTPTEFHFNVTRCRYAEMYREMGLAELGAILSCNRDGAFCEGYDPKLKMERTQTLMSGAPHCDFRYRYEAEAPKDSPAD
ncbi:L-2-amino-thiazoline-4-carboxylic acid hydrolase [Rhodovastum atsumiense]|uniref:2-amino-thiazoline-4-carboxylic acid hydrolase n=1 Tax=Rhodovastum atsumiense TaxID=504468 RepID=A0A5M6IW97_9PROT|nr:L-2-amino-thiazoline-4-carboxylic acid hydrolase [Rhodovastum atsumiense]KAA5611675.1 2-amino-thiazoline-4-carboxylic acid hydrolase [Rhodovastum atsumiense]CAH2604248.1 L-2-amino-thiazoline-4-carboxylic acid hydrolase [Rhodovastum atsumiense]